MYKKFEFNGCFEFVRIRIEIFVLGNALLLEYIRFHWIIYPKLSKPH